MALAVIFGLYSGIGILAALGAVAISRKQFTPRIEPVFFGFLLIPIAAIYFAFCVHFGARASWRIEALAVVGFALLSLVGIRFPLLRMLADVLHGAWDLLHENRRIRNIFERPDRNPAGLRGILRSLRLVHRRVLLHPAGSLGASTGCLTSA